MKKNKCKWCGLSFVQYNSIQNICIKCAIIKAKQDRIAKAKKNKVERLETKRQKEALRPRSWYVKRMITAFNAFIRERDKNEPCISCGRHHGGVYHCGHFLTTKSRPWLAVHPCNASKQCYSCNVPLSGNITEFRKGLVRKFGIEMVAYLENSYSDYIFTVHDMGEITKHYRKRLKNTKL